MLQSPVAPYVRDAILSLIDEVERKAPHGMPRASLAAPMPTEKLSIDLSGVPETLLLPLFGRATDARSARPILGDRAAADLVERLEFDFGRISWKLSAYSSLYWARRALTLDGVVRAFLARHPGATVVNLGAGLDTTFQRVDDGAVRWFDLDLPAVAAIRRRLLGEGPRQRLLEGSFLDWEWVDALGVSRGDPVLMISGGVFFYLGEDELRPFFARLPEALPGSEVAFDTLSAFGAFATNRYLRRVGMKSAPIRWTTTGADAVCAWSPGARPLRVYPIFKGMDADPSWSLGLRSLLWLTDAAPVGQILHLALR